MSRFPLVLATVAIISGTISSIPDRVTAAEKTIPSSHRVVPASGGQIWVKISPSHLIMGEKGDARVEAILPRGASDVVFFAAHGRVEHVAMQSPTRVTAKYYKPKGFLPRIDVVAVLASVDGENRWGYATVILFGQGEASVQTHKGARTTVRIGKQKYGPLKADNSGKATFQVIVPPGIQVGRDGTGRTVDLHVPITARTAVFAQKSKIAPEVDREIELFGVVTSQNGTSDEDSTIEINANQGKVDQLHSIGSGAFVARYTPPKLKKGQIQIESVVPGDDDSPPSNLSLKIVPPPWHVEQFTVSQDQPDEPAERSNRARLMLTPKLGIGINPHNAMAFHFAGDFGALLPIGKEFFSVALELGTAYSKSDDIVVINEQTIEVEWTTWYLSVLACFGWQREFTDLFSLLVGVQGGFLYLDSELVFDPKNQNSFKSSIKHETIPRGAVGVHLSIGWDLGPGTLLGDLRVLWAPGYYETLNSDFSSIIIDIGYRIWFL